MSLDNSTIQHPLPGDLQARIENALNLVTSLEAEHQRLERLIGAKKSEHSSIHDDIKSSENKLEGLKNEIVDASKESSERNDELNRLYAAIKNANLELEESQRQKVEITADLAKRCAELEKQIDQANQNDEAIHLRHLALGEKELAHQKKVERLLAALN